MLDNSNHNRSLNATSMQGTPVWQSGWIEELWNQLENGTFNGIGNVVVDDDVAGSEQQLLSDLSAIDRMLVGTRDIQQMLSEVRDFAEQNRNTFGNASRLDPLTGTDFDAQAYQAATSLTEVLQYVQAQGLPDLTAEIGPLKFDEIALPGEKANLSVTLKNQGGLRTRHAVTAKIYAQAQPGSTPTAEPSVPIELGSLNFGKLKIAPGHSRKVSTRVELPDNLAPGDYNIFVVVDTDGNVPEANEANNIVAAATTQTVAWKFGNLNGENRVLNLRDGDGDNIRFQLKGDGYGEITQAEGVKQLTVYGTTDQSEVVIKGNGDGHTLSNIVINGDLKRLYGTNTDLQGNLTITGSLDRLTLGDVNNAQIAIGQSADPAHTVDIKLGEVSNVSLVSSTRIDELDAVSWTTTVNSDGNGNSVIVAPEIREIDIKGDLNTNLEVTGELKTVKVQGTAAGSWKVGGDNRLTKLGSTAEDWSFSVGGHLKYLDVQANLQGTIVADGIKRVFVRGNLNEAKLLVGADLGADGVIGGNDDTYGQGSIDVLTVHGDILSSVIGAGLDPSDTDFTNGNEQLVTGGSINKLTVQGSVSEDSLIAATHFAKTVTIGEQTVLPEEDARFLVPSKVVVESPGEGSLDLSSTTNTDDIRLAREQSEKLWSFEARAGGTC